jgi:hypothetical protein
MKHDKGTQQAACLRFLTPQYQKATVERIPVFDGALEETFAAE